MPALERINRRDLLVKLGLLFDGCVGLLLAVPIVRYLWSPVTLGRREGYESWVSLGTIDQYPVGQTRLATYQNPVATPADGETAKVACWVRRIDDERFQVFAVNCAHLGCPVRWFPQSGLFMCPCHGGVYYANGERASGPPPRGLFHCVWRVRRVDDSDLLEIQAPHYPTLQDTLQHPA